MSVKTVGEEKKDIKIEDKKEIKKDDKNDVKKEEKKNIKAIKLNKILNKTNLLVNVPSTSELDINKIKNDINDINNDKNNKQNKKSINKDLSDVKEREDQELKALISAYDTSLSMGERENAELKKRLKELEGYF